MERNKIYNEDCLVEYQTEERVFLDRLEKAKKGAAENFGGV